MNKLLIACVCVFFSQPLLAAQEETVGGIGGTGSQEEITGGIGGTGIRDMERPERLENLESLESLESLERPELLESHDAIDDLLDMEASDAAGFDNPASDDLPGAELP